MEMELESVRRWFSRLRSMQICAADISGDTPEELPDFYSTKHAGILKKKLQRDSFSFCVFRNTGISVGDADFVATSSFRELLDEAHRRLRTAVRGLFRAVAIEQGSVPASQDPLKFESRKTKEVFDTDEKIDSLCDSLASVMPIFPQTASGQKSFKVFLKNDATTVKDGLDRATKE